ncbi:30S ribosomal protein S8 [Candidatus Woesearchaeota archaeon CG07_land_8_20_14_0_80_44_23]|nr:MAG: 30S ribosomal protein S8 [Candidatus Woesearchaeota archaeon CG07_land_8_20_14_0_80_44_23]
MLNDTVANLLDKMYSFEKAGKKKCTVRPFSKVGKRVLEILHENLYIGDFEEGEDERGRYVTVNLIGSINECRAIKPRFAVSMETYDKFEKRFLPASDFGILIISTNRGIKSHSTAKKEKLGGKLIAYCY